MFFFHQEMEKMFTQRHNQRIFWGNTTMGCYICPGISVNTYRKIVVPRTQGWHMVVKSVGCPNRARRTVEEDMAFYYRHRGLVCSDLCFGYNHSPTGSFRPIFTYTYSKRMGQLCAALPREVAKQKRRWARDRRAMVRVVLGGGLVALPMELIRLIARLAY